MNEKKLIEMPTLTKISYGVPLFEAPSPSPKNGIEITHKTKAIEKETMPITKNILEFDLVEGCDVDSKWHFSQKYTRSLDVFPQIGQILNAPLFSCAPISLMRPAEERLI